MKKSVIVGLCLTLLLSCREKIEPNTLGITYREEVKWAIDGKKITVKLNELTEGRCIGDEIVCIWGGMISMKFVIENQQVDLFSTRWGFEQTTQPLQGEQSDFVVNGQTYTLQLNRVDIKNPDKGLLARTPKENYTVFVIIKKK